MEASGKPVAAAGSGGSRLVIYVKPLVSVGLFGIALFVLDRELREYHLQDLVNEAHALGPRAIVAALLLTAVNYLALTGYDRLSLAILGKALPYRRVALASFVAYVFSHNAGLSFLGGSAVRFRLYSSWELSTAEIASVVVFNAVTFWLGFLSLLGSALLIDPPALPVALTAPVPLAGIAGLSAIAVVIAYLLATGLRRSPIHVREEEIQLPSFRLSLAQLVLSVIDWLLAAAVLFVLLPAGIDLSLPRFAVVYLVAQLAALASHVPAGLGVLEGGILIGLHGQAAPSALIGSLVMYRMVYYLLPLVAGVALLGGYELRRRRALFGRAESQIARWTTVLVPHVLTLTTFLGGVILLISGATPPAEGRMDWVGDVLPLPAIELSHFAGSLLGIALVLLARGLQLRVDAAYVLSVVFLGLGIAASLLKGFDYEEAIILTGMLIALLPCRRHFYRKASLLDEPFSSGWVAAIALAVAGTGWLMMFSFRHVEYAHELWWQFEIQSHAPRALRAAVGGGLLVAAFGLVRLLRPARPDAVPPSRDDLAAVRELVRTWPEAAANLALLGDKAFLFNEKRDAFIMYGVAGRSWVAMGDPIGEVEQGRELAWRFRELSDRYAGWTVFYEVGEQNLGLYLDLGLTLLKLGEEARIHLPDFSLEGGARKSLRQHHQRMQRDGCELEFVSPERVPEHLDDLQRISDAWLSLKKTREKGFSLGRFSREYITQFPAALVRVRGTTVAFANVWPGAPGEELAVDLMRHGPDAPPGVMDFLFVELMQWAKTEGYRYFNLGMAPLSGFESRPLAPLWNRVGAFLYRHGEELYNFQGLRDYKEKFRPEWRPRYIALPGGLALPVVLANVASLIAGGLRGVVSR